jgi:hypothetical protein
VLLGGAGVYRRFSVTFGAGRVLTAGVADRKVAGDMWTVGAGEGTAAVVEVGAEGRVWRRLVASSVLRALSLFKSVSIPPVTWQRSRRVLNVYRWLRSWPYRARVSLLYISSSYSELGICASLAR